MVGKGLKIEDRGIQHPLTLGSDVVVRQTLPADNGDMLGLLVRGDKDGKADPLNAGAAIL